MITSLVSRGAQGLEHPVLGEERAVGSHGLGDSVGVKEKPVARLQHEAVLRVSRAGERSHRRPFAPVYE